MISLVWICKNWSVMLSWDKIEGNKVIERLVEGMNDGWE